MEPDALEPGDWVSVDGRGGLLTAVRSENGMTTFTVLLEDEETDRGFCVSADGGAALLINSARPRCERTFDTTLTRYTLPAVVEGGTCLGHQGVQRRKNRMRLLEFRITNYRSVNDSGPVKVSPRTALVGRNESGKSSLLLALQTVNPSSAFAQLNKVKDYPRDRKLTECNDGTSVVETQWELTDDEQRALAVVYPRARSIREVTVRRNYGFLRSVDFCELGPATIDSDLVRQSLKTLQASVGSASRKLTDAEKAAVLAQVERLSSTVLETTSDLAAWTSATASAVANFRASLPSHNLPVPERAANALDDIEKHTRDLTQEEEQAAAGRKWVVETLPVFVYLSDYPELEGHQNIGEYLSRKDDGEQTEAD